MTFEEWFQSVGFENEISDKATLYGGCVLLECWDAAYAEGIAQRHTSTDWLIKRIRFLEQQIAETKNENR